ncbi:hypothetical protein [Vibrio mimicus]|uniref:hypothetical protein n=1 Tax=Vibrio mimicus TaxID=674 RepID=UPI0009BD1ACD|nr:hypothetical protein [Vibrio mimicus]AMG01930.2 hypothetical protein AL543_02565 [Vibrio mimicus]KAA3493206.1 hypothetical protein Y058_05555 [Vibrio mimicus]
MNKELEQAMAQLMAMSEEAKAALGTARNDLKELAELKKQSSELLNECLQLAELGPKSKFKQICEPDSALKNRDIYDIVHAINVLAMANTDVLHIFTHFSGHVNELEVQAMSAETVYKDGHPQVRLLSEQVWLGRDNALDRLLAIESQLTELIIEAREAAEIVEEGI